MDPICGNFNRLESHFFQVFSMIPGFSSELMPKGREQESQAKIKRYMYMMDSMTNEGTVMPFDSAITRSFIICTLVNLWGPGHGPKNPVNGPHQLGPSAHTSPAAYVDHQTLYFIGLNVLSSSNARAVPSPPPSPMLILCRPSCSFTELDSSNLKLMNDSRIMRIARGSGRPIVEVMEMLEEYKRLAKVWSKMKGLKIPKKGEMSALSRNINAQHMSKVLPPQIMKQLGGMGGLQNLMKQMGNMGNPKDMMNGLLWSEKNMKGKCKWVLCSYAGGALQLKKTGFSCLFIIFRRRWGFLCMKATRWRESDLIWEGGRKESEQNLMRTIHHNFGFSNSYWCTWMALLTFLLVVGAPVFIVRTVKIQRSDE